MNWLNNNNNVCRAAPFWITKNNFNGYSQIASFCLELNKIGQQNSKLNILNYFKDFKTSKFDLHFSFIVLLNVQNLIIWIYFCCKEVKGQIIWLCVYLFSVVRLHEMIIFTGKGYSPAITTVQKQHVLSHIFGFKFSKHYQIIKVTYDCLIPGHHPGGWWPGLSGPAPTPWPPRTKVGHYSLSS